MIVCFLQAIQEQMKIHGQEVISFQDVKVHTHMQTHTPTHIV